MRSWICALGILLFGCVDPALTYREELRARVLADPSTPEAVKAAVRAGQLLLGMTVEQVQAVLGRPWNAAQNLSAGGGVVTILQYCLNTNPQMGPVGAVMTYCTRWSRLLHLRFINDRLTGMTHY